MANLRADLAEARADLVEADREDEARERFDVAIRESTNAMMREALGSEMYSRLWGPELERLGYACDRLRADLVESRTKELDAETRACAAEERAARAEAALRRVGKVVGCPRDDWCEVADATEAVFGSLDQRAREAEAQCAAMRAALVKQMKNGLYLVEDKVALQGCLADDAGRDLLTAVRRLCEVSKALLMADDEAMRAVSAVEALLR